MRLPYVVTLVNVPYLPGDGTIVIVGVAYIADYPRDGSDKCAFCHGDPLNIRSAKQSEIDNYYLRNPLAETCPMCGGRPT